MALNSKTILVADADPNVLFTLETALLREGFRVVTAQDGTEAVRLVQESGRIAAAILDLGIPQKDALTALFELRQSVADLPVVILSESSQPATIIAAMRAGAADYLMKPVAQQDLLAAVNRVTARDPEEETGSIELPAKSGFLYMHPSMERVQLSLSKVAPWNVPVLLSGESGVGKEVVARELHRLSPRAKRPLIKINCVSLPSELLESELFGYEKGAFTGAFRSKPGKFEMASGGTILLDEIGDMDFKLQAKLLQVLQDSQFHRLGGHNAVQVDVRVVVATHRDLEKGITEGWFREDLYYRLSVVTVAVPALRQRREEILPLAQHFLIKHRQPGYAVPAIAPVLKTALLAYDWPGNVRELENVIRRLLVFNDTEMIITDLRMRQERRQPERAEALRATASGGRPDPCAPEPESIPTLASSATFETADSLREIIERLAAALTPASRGYPTVTGHAEGTLQGHPESQPVPPLDKVGEEARELERQVILSALHQTNWNRRRAAALLRVDYKGLLYRMKKLGIATTSGNRPTDDTSRTILYAAADE